MTIGTTAQTMESKFEYNGQRGRICIITIGNYKPDHIHLSNLLFVIAAYSTHTQTVQWHTPFTDEINIRNTPNIMNIV